MVTTSTQNSSTYTETTLAERQNASKIKGDALPGLDMDQFIKLMITEMQNQDPMDPMKNDEILQQISQIRSIDSTTKLTETLNSVLMGQNLTSANSMLGKNIQALSDTSTEVTGMVDRVTMENGEAKVHVGKNVVSLKNIRAIDLPNT